MSRDGSGNYSLPAGNPVVTGATISSSTHNTTMSDIASALTASIAKDGQTTPTANLPMGGYKHTGVADATARTDYAKVSQIQDGGYVTLSSVAGADTITATVSPAISAYAAGQYFQFVSAGANTGAATLNINGLGAKAITKEGTTALAAGDIASGAVVGVVYDGTRFQLVEGRRVQPLDATLTALAGILTAANKIPYATALDTASELNFNPSTALAASTSTVPSQTVVKTAIDDLIVNCTGATPDASADYFVFEDATDNTQKKALLSTIGTISASSLAANGYITLSNGLTVQWGTKALSSTTQAIDYTTEGVIDFPTATLVVLAGGGQSSGSYYDFATHTYLTTGFTAYSNSGTTTIHWIAIGH